MTRLALVLLSAVLLAGCGRERGRIVLPAAEARPPSAAPAPTAAASSAAPSIPEIVGRFAPRDECGGSPGWDAFFLRLGRAIGQRDAAGLVALADPGIVLDFGGGSGAAELQRRLSGSDGIKLWAELDAILKLGCAAGPETGNAVLPWFFGQSLGAADPYQVLLVAGEKVPLRAVPDSASPAIALVTWDIVDGIEERGAFRKVSLPGGRQQGYIASGALRSPLDYRLVAQRQRGEWRLMAFVAGD